MPKNKKEITKRAQRTPQINETTLFKQISKIIESRKTRAGMFANQEVTLMYWEVGRYIKSNILDGDRAEYGKRIVSTVSAQLVKKYGKSFETRNLRRMVQFAELFPDKAIVSPLASQLSWSHIVELLPLKTAEARLYYANDAAVRNLGKLELRRQISRKAMDKSGIAVSEYWTHLPPKAEFEQKDKRNSNRSKGTP